MTLPAAGQPIACSQVDTEFGLASSSKFSDYYGKGGAPAAGALALSDMAGRSAVVPPAITTTNPNPYVGAYNQSASATIACVAGKTIASITLVAGSASPRINPGTTGGASTTGTITAPAVGTAVVDATYRYTTNTGESVDVEFSGQWSP